MLSGARRAKHRGGKTEMENTGSRFPTEQNRGAHSTKKTMARTINDRQAPQALFRHAPAQVTPLPLH